MRALPEIELMPEQADEAQRIADRGSRMSCRLRRRRWCGTCRS